MKMKGREEIGETVDLKRCTAAGAPSAPTNFFSNFKIKIINHTWMRPIPSAVRVLHPHWDYFHFFFSIFLKNLSGCGSPHPQCGSTIRTGENFDNFSLQILPKLVNLKINKILK